MEMWKESPLKQFTKTKEIDAAYPILLNFFENLGFNYCAIMVTSPFRQLPSKAIKINNYPEEWNQQYENERYGELDPVVTHCNRSMMPILWNETDFAQTPQIWLGLQKHGIRHGWSQSFHHEESGLCSILSLARQHLPISPLELYEHFGYMLYVTRHLSELFAQILPHKPSSTRLPHLSPREMDVLRLSALGKTAYEISMILKVTERTVNYHVQNLILKLNVCNKISAVIAAARAGII